MGFLNRTGAERGYKPKKKCLKKSFSVIEKSKKIPKVPSSGNQRVNPLVPRVQKQKKMQFNLKSTSSH